MLHVDIRYWNYHEQTIDYKWPMLDMKNMQSYTDVYWKPCDNEELPKFFRLLQ